MTTSLFAIDPHQAPPQAIALVMATRGRSETITAFLNSMRGQREAPAELLIVDQNDDDRVRRAVAAAGLVVPVRIIHAKPGLSAARNLGASSARSPLIGFPDDDCTYPEGLLDRVLQWFEEHPEAHGLSCRVCDHRGRGSAGGYMSRRAQWITRSNVWRTAATPGLFVRREVQSTIGGFDEQLGVGSRWGSGEETDYVLRAIEAGFRIYYEPFIHVLHSRRRVPLKRDEVIRGWRYGRGAGFVLARHGYGLASAMYYSTVPIMAAPLALIQAEPGKAVERLLAGAGRMTGWIRACRETRIDTAVLHRT